MMSYSPFKYRSLKAIVIIAIVSVGVLQNASAHRNLSDSSQERKDLMNAMNGRLSSIMLMLNNSPINHQNLQDDTLYLSKASEFAFELFGHSEHDNSPSENLINDVRFKQLLTQLN